MKVQVLTLGPAASALRRRFQLEEDEIVEHSPELSLPQDFLHAPVPGIVAEGFYGQGSGEPTHFFTRFWDGHWHPQTAVGVPLRGLMSEGLGPDCYNGCSLRFVDQLDHDLFEHTHLEEMLRLTRFHNGTPWKGFVSFVMSEKKVLWIEKSIPFHGIFPLLEGVTARRSEFLRDPMKHEFKTSWFYAGLLLTRSPWPHHKMTKEKVLVEGITSRIEKHFWAFSSNVERYSFRTEFTELGVATAWSDTLSDTMYRVDRTCRNILAPFKQFRTDAYRAYDQQWEKVSTYV